MAINWGLALAETGKAAGKFRDERAQRQERLEDRLAQKEMRELQKRSLEQALAREPAEPTWDTRETESGEFVQIDPRTGQARRVVLDDVVVRAPKKAEPAPSFSFQTDKDGNVVGINPKNPQQVVQTGIQAPPKATPEPAGSADRKAKLDAAISTLAILDEIAKDVEMGGTDIDPRSSRRAGLASKYAQFQLKLKDAARLGALSQSDLDIMLNALNDPTSAVARAKVLGSADTHRANVLAGTASVRSTLEREISRMQGSNASAGGEDFTDAELSAAWNAGKRTDAEIAEWIRANRSPSVPK